MAEETPRFDVLGVGVSRVNMESALDVIAGWIRDGSRRYVCATGVHGVIESQRDEALRRIHNAAGLVVPDGMPLVWVARLKGLPDVGVTPGPDLMLAAFRNSEPRLVPMGGWHLPLVQDDEQSLDIELRKRLSVARCARVSYLTHEGTRDHQKDLELFERLVAGGANGHWSPFEHAAAPLPDGDAFTGNFRGWKQFRKFFAAENATTLPAEPVPDGTVDLERATSA